MLYIPTLRSPVSGLWVEGHVYPSPEGLSIYFHNITERRAVEAERAELLVREQRARVEAEATSLVLLGHPPGRVKTERFGPTGGGV